MHICICDFQDETFFGHRNVEPFQLEMGQKEIYIFCTLFSFSFTFTLAYACSVDIHHLKIEALELIKVKYILNKFQINFQIQFNLRQGMHFSECEHFGGFVVECKGESKRYFLWRRPCWWMTLSSVPKTKSNLRSDGRTSRPSRLKYDDNESWDCNGTGLWWTSVWQWWVKRSVSYGGELDPFRIVLWCRRPQAIKKGQTVKLFHQPHLNGRLISHHLSDRTNTGQTKRKNGKQINKKNQPNGMVRGPRK